MIKRVIKKILDGFPGVRKNERNQLMNHNRNNELTIREELFISNLKKKVAMSVAGRTRHGRKVWIPMSILEIAKEMGCCKNTAVSLVRKLCSLGAIQRRQLSSDRMDRRWYYSTCGPGPKKSIFSTATNFDMSTQPNMPESSEIQSSTYGSCAATVREALAVWNRELGREDRLYQDLARYLMAAIRDKFNRSLEKWRKFVLRLKSSKFLMRNGWFCLKWVLLYRNMKKILAGELGILREAFVVSNHQLGDGERHIASLTEDMKCIEIRRRILRRRGESVYMSWMPNIQLKFQDGRVSIASASSRFVEDWVSSHFWELGSCVEEDHWIRK